MSIEKKIFAANLCVCGFDLQKRWFVKVKVPHFEKGCFVWKKCYGDINKFTTVDERMAALHNLLEHINITQNYKNVQGSRYVGYVDEKFVTDVCYQLNVRLSLRSHSVRKSTHRKYVSLISNMQRWLKSIGNPKLPVGAFTTEHTSTFLTWLKHNQQLSNSTYNACIVLFRSFFCEMVKAEIIKKNPFLDFRTLPKNSVPSLYFSNFQALQLKNEISQKDKTLWLFVQIIYYCFIRPNEIRNMKIADINLCDQRIQILGTVSKNNKTQYVSIPSQLLASLKSLILQHLPKDWYLFGKDGTPGPYMIGENTMKTRHQKILKGLGYDTRHKLYSWKHTGAIACARAGMSLKDLQMQLRHHSLDQVNTYLSDMHVYESDFIKNSFPSL